MSKLSLQVMQKAILNFLGSYLPEELHIGSISPLILQAEFLLGFQNAKINVLKNVFDLVSLNKKEFNTSEQYIPLQEIVCTSGLYPIIPYPTTISPDALQIYCQKVGQELKSDIAERWNDSQFLSFILEKYGACVSYGDPYVALVDAARIWAALSENLNSNTSEFCLIAGSLSGIQRFIYTISSSGALKSLRARSFYLELVTEEVVQQLLHRFDLPRTNVIYAGGGNLFLMAPTPHTDDQLVALRNEVNNWLDDTFQGKVFLSLAYQSCAIDSVNSAAFRECWNNTIALVNAQKLQRYEGRIHELNQMLKVRPSHYPPCGVCHRDDVAELNPLNNKEPDSPLACPICIQIYELGDILPDVKALLRTPRSISRGSCFSLKKMFSSFYHIYDCTDLLIPFDRQTDNLYLVNNWETINYKNVGNALPLLLGNYYQPKTGENGSQRFPTAEEFADSSEGVHRVGYLRMDVDRLGQIFAFGLSDSDYSLPRVAGLSRQLSYFFKVYLNSLAEDRQKNLYDRDNSLTKFSSSNRQNLLFIYAGGDDLFVSGAWNEVIEFAMDIYQSFRAFTGWNPDITLSGGVSINDPKFPLYQAAATSGEAEHQAKSNDRDSFCAFSQAFKWQEWFGYSAKRIITTLRDREQQYWNKADPNPDFSPQVGIIPLVKLLLEKTKNHTLSRSFLRNLLQTADMQDRLIKELNNKQRQSIYGEEIQDIRYYLHLPQIAYTIARLPPEARDDLDLRKALKCPYNAPYFRAIATWIELLRRAPP